MKWIKANEKPVDLLQSYYCKVLSSHFGKEFRKTVLITLDGSWQTGGDDRVIEWLDESPSKDSSVLVEALEKLIKQYSEQVEKYTGFSKKPFGSAKANDMWRHKSEGLNRAKSDLTKILAQYNAVEPEKWIMVEDQPPTWYESVWAEFENGNHACVWLAENEQGLIWTVTGTDVVVNPPVKYKCLSFVQSQSPPTPIDREPEGIDGMGADPL